jgi:hypothetical protein
MRMSPGVARIPVRIRPPRLQVPLPAFLHLVVLALAAAPAFAAHPLLTEDTGTQGTGRFELELGVAEGGDGGTKALEFGPQLSYGALDSLDLIVRPTWLTVRGAAEDGTTQGFGDTGVDFKWRFWADGPLSFGVRAGAAIPTGDNDKGLGNGKTSPHAILIATYNAEAWWFGANLDYAYDPLVGDRRNEFGATVAAVHSVRENLRASAELGTAVNPDASKTSWLGFARFGAMATVARWLDIDAAYQFRLTRAAPVRIVLVGATFHW